MYRVKAKKGYNTIISKFNLQFQSGADWKLVNDEIVNDAKFQSFVKYLIVEKIGTSEELKTETKQEVEPKSELEINNEVPINKTKENAFIVGQLPQNPSNVFIADHNDEVKHVKQDVEEIQVSNNVEAVEVAAEKIVTEKDTTEKEKVEPQVKVKPQVVDTTKVTNVKKDVKKDTKNASNANSTKKSKEK